MTSFFKNICRFNQCGLEYASLYDLIQHIEETHIVNDVECQKRFELLQQHGQQPAPLVSLSFICRYYQKLPDRKPRTLLPEPVTPTFNTMTVPNKKRPSVSASFPTNTLPTPPVVQISFQPPIAPGSAAPSMTPAGSEADEDSLSVDNESLSSDSTVVDDAAADPNHANNRFLSPANVEERRYACPVAGCKKKYKNINGVRYHSKSAHQNADQPQNIKAYKCSVCTKAYKTNNGLHNHQVQSGHKSNNPVPPTAIQQMKQQQQQQQHGFPVTLITSSSSTPAKGAAMRVSPAQSPSISLTGQNHGLKLTPSGNLSNQMGVSSIPSGVSVQVQSAGSQGGTTTVHVPQQGATGPASVLNVSVLGARSYTTAGMKRSASIAQMTGGNRPLKMPAAMGQQRSQLVHNFVSQTPQQGGMSSTMNQTGNSAGEAASSIQTSLMGPPSNTVHQYMKQ